MLILSLFFSVLLACSSGGDGGPNNPPPPVNEDIIPTNLSLSIDIIGANGDNPNGDGSGMIQCTASATNAISYGFRFGTGSEIESISGMIEHAYQNPGLNNYSVFVFAYSSTGHFISASQIVNVYVDDDVQLIWFDEFDTPGAPDNSKWNYNIGNGDNGWGNAEEQFYTSRAENVIVEDGLLKITAKAESYSGHDYTSARLLTENKFDFTYGRIEIRAKLPEGAGTWPALWMLGSNFSTVGWPACGEIDIMEHWGTNPGRISSATHTPSSFGGTVNVGDTTVNDFSTAFHVYSLEWTADKLDFYVDDTWFLHL